MRQYGLSKSKLINVLYKPERKEQGIAEGTMAVMKSNKVYSTSKAPLSLKAPAWRSKKAPGEIWLMYKDTKDMRKIISAWRYPGVSKPGDGANIIPEDIKEELMHGNY